MLDKRNISTILIAVVLLICAGCFPNLDDAPRNQGDIDLTNYVAIGDNLCAGYNETGLDPDRQHYSYPNMLHWQFDQVTDLQFNQPTLQANVNTGDVELTEIISSSCEFTADVPAFQESNSTVTALANQYVEGPYNELGVPWMKIEDITSLTFGADNQFFRRLQNPQNSDQTYTELLIENLPSFATISLGMSEVFPFAISGGTTDALTSNYDFESGYNALLNSLYDSLDDFKAVLINIPQIDDIPYFSEQTHFYVDPVDCDGNQRAIFITQGNGQVRIAQESDKILLSAREVLGADDGSGNRIGLMSQSPLPDDMVLDSIEAKQVSRKIFDLNFIIKEIAKQRDFALADIRMIMHDVNLGWKLNGTEITSEFIYGGFYSLDGIFPSPRGNAFIANTIIEAINDEYEARIPKLNIFDYPSVWIP